MTTALPSLRLARPDDEKRVLAWRNDPWIVALGTGCREVTAEEHAAWFRSVLADADRRLFIIESDGGEPIGTVRLDRERGEEAALTVYLIRPFTGLGLGPRAVRAACDAMFQSWPALRRVVAHIRADNVASRKAFARSGFVPETGGGPCPEGHVRVARFRGVP